MELRDTFFFINNELCRFYFNGKNYLILRFYPSLDEEGVPSNLPQVLMLFLKGEIRIKC